MNNPSNPLCQTLLREGPERCRAALQNTYRQNPRRAAMLLNDPSLTFPCLYILREAIESLSLRRSLIPRNRIALRACAQILKSDEYGPDVLSTPQEPARSALKWMLETGAEHPAPQDADFEEIMDVTISVLLILYGERDILPLAASILFTRNRGQRYTHDLVWAMLETHDPQALRALAAGLLSNAPEDRALAAELLNLEELEIDPAGDPNNAHTRYLDWLSENDPFLYFTGEGFQYSAKPAFCAVDRERKYLQVAAAGYDPMPANPSGQTEQALAVFKTLGGQEQRLLSDYSHRLRAENAAGWQQWISSPVEEQIKAASASGEAFV